MTRYKYDHFQQTNQTRMRGLKLCTLHQWLVQFNTCSPIDKLNSLHLNDLNTCTNLKKRQDVYLFGRTAQWICVSKLIDLDLLISSPKSFAWNIVILLQKTNSNTFWFTRYPTFVLKLSSLADRYNRGNEYCDVLNILIISFIPPNACFQYSVLL